MGHAHGGSAGLRRARRDLDAAHPAQCRHLTLEIAVAIPEGCTLVTRVLKLRAKVVDGNVTLEATLSVRLVLRAETLRDARGRSGAVERSRQMGGGKWSEGSEG